MNHWSKSINCPQCGNELPLSFQHSKLTVCSHCSSTIFLEDEAVRLAGKQSVLSEVPSLLELGSPFQYRKTSFIPVGKIRYAHPVGFWEEWWSVDNTGNGFWVSVDEGDFAFEKPLDVESSLLPKASDLKLGESISLFNNEWQVTEIGQGKCMGFQGELPEVIQVNERVPFVHLSGYTGQLITLEYFHDITRAYQGEWVDPFEITSAI